MSYRTGLVGLGMADVRKGEITSRRLLQEGEQPLPRSE